MNSFFLIDNFVLHQEQGGSRTSDSDLLGVRFPYVSETFGGQEKDWDEKLFGKVDKNKILGFICEVKTGLDFRRGDLFRPDNVLKSIRRLGFTENIDLYSEEIINNATVSIGEYEIYKVLFSRKKESPRPDCIHIKLYEVDKFLKARFDKYRERKYADRMFFPSSLVQYMIWQEYLKN